MKVLPSFPARGFLCRALRSLAWGLPLVLFVWVGLFIPSALAHPHTIAATAPGRTETGVPPFAIRNREAIGLNSEPTDIKLLPDGRVLLFAGRQLAYGDGVRWDVFSQAEDDKSVPSTEIAVNAEGRIFLGIRGGFGEVVFDDTGHWRIKVAALWENEQSALYPVLRKVQDVGSTWLWHGESGPIVDWQPGKAPVSVGRFSRDSAVFAAGNQFYASDRAEGLVNRLSPTGQVAVPLPGGRSLDAIVECGTPADETHAMVGMHSRGLHLFDGIALQPIARRGLLATPNRITAVERTREGFYVASIQDRGIVFFTKDGRVLQFLSRDVDHRLGHVVKLLPAAGGLVHALLEEGLAIIQFPSPASSFEALIGRAVSFSHPFRVGDDLWLETDGTLLRGLYDDAGTLTSFVVDQPGSSYVSVVSQVDNTVIVSNADGCYIRRGDRWDPLFSGIADLRVISEERNGRWLIIARGLLGWLVRSGTSYSLVTYPTPEMVAGYEVATGRDGATWLEMGNGRLGRVTLREDGVPQLEVLRGEQGVPDGWAQVFKVGDEVSFNIADQILRYDRDQRRLVPDPELAASFVGAGRITGRPTRDADGNVWLADERGPARWIRSGGKWTRQSLNANIKFGPHTYAVQPDGVVWLEANGRHVRYDTRAPLAAPEPMRAVVTHLEISGNKRIHFTNTKTAPEFGYGDGTLSIHFVALGGTPFSTTTFDVLLGKSKAEWTPVGSGGVASYNNLKEGTYSFRVRPRSGEDMGAESVFEFTIHPPWYRTSLAYLAYFLATLTLVTTVAWSASYLQRRETMRLEELVAQRTAELNESNSKLERQVEEIRRLSLAIEQSPVGVAITRSNGTIVFANPRFCDLFGYLHDEVVGREIASLRLQPFTPSLNSQILKTIEAGESWHGQLTNQTKDGRGVHVRTTIAPIRSPDGRIRSHLILEEDISEWLAEQDRRHRLETQLLQAQKLDALGTLAGGIAHDFNNILTGILGYCELANLDIDEQERLRVHLDEIKGAGLRAKDLVARILTFARQSTPTLAPMDLAHAVHEAQKLLRASTPAMIEYALNIKPASILADATQIHQVVVNLCTNAIHAIQGKPGRIEVEVQPVVLSAEEASDLHDIKPGNAVKLRVSDTGHGMDADTLARIFDPFFTTKQPGHGTGLGLAIVRAIVQNHRGAIRVRSAPGTGTTFELFFPATERSATTSPFGEVAPEGDGQRILVVDDEATIANFVANRLRRLEYEVDVFNEPKKALERLLAEPYRYTAIVTDLTMPEMTGLQMLAAARAGGRKIPAIIVSGYGVELGTTDPASLEKCLLLPKPFNGNDLARALQQILAEE